MSEPMPIAHAAETAPAGTMYQRCLDQIDEELAFLTGLADALRGIRAAIGAGGIDGLSDALQLQDATARRAADMQERRQAWREEMAARLGIRPDAVTVAAIAATVDAAAQATLLAARDRLHARVHEVSRLNGGNAFLVRAYLEALQRFFLDLTGAGATSGRYGRAGASRAPVYGSLMQLEG